MIEEKIIQYLIKEKKLDKEDIRKILKSKPTNEDTVSFLFRLGLISYKDLNVIAEFASSEGTIDKRALEKQGIIFEDVYLHYNKDDDSVYVVPYYHIRAVEKRKNVVNIYIGGVEKISIKLENENTADALMDVLLLYINKVFLR